MTREMTQRHGTTISACFGRRMGARAPWIVLILCCCVPAVGCRSVSTVAGSRTFAHAAVAADHPAASAAGAEMLQRGGNAVDAAVAASFCLSVVRPYSCGIGGGGFMVVHMPTGTDGRPARSVAINYRETAPGVVGRDYYVGREQTASRFGVHAVGVPGTVAGLLEALERYGTLDRATVIAPAIRAAEDGYVIDAHAVDAAEAIAERLVTYPELADGAGSIWTTLCAAGQLRVGDRVRNHAQARALRLIAAHGASAFYEGPIADAIVRVMDDHGGPISRADLAGYRVDITAPVRGEFDAYEVISMPPPSSGGITIQQILGILAHAPTDLAQAEPNDDRYVHLLAEAMKHAFADRARWLADPAYVAVPTERLLDPAYLAGRAASISATSTRPAGDYGTATWVGDDHGTSHVSVIDADGMAVACTETINLRFGALVEVPGFGFALNNEMDDFTTIPGAPNAFGLRQSDDNLPEPGKRPLSSMSPTIVLRDGRAVVIAGASGGPRIITGTLQAMLNCLLFDMSARDAVEAPRFHHQWLPDTLLFDERWTDRAAIDRLVQRGHDIGTRPTVGEVQLIKVDPHGVHAASDTRKGGQPAGQ